MTAPLVLERFGAADVAERIAAAGVVTALAARGFGGIVVEIVAGALPVVRVRGTKEGREHLLIEAHLGAATIPVEFFAAQGHAIDRPVELVLVWWLREEDPTAPFAAERPALPLQHHPGLGVLRRAFRAVVGMAREIGADGVASVPKFFHDAAIFLRSRLFLFLDPEEQGRFDALARDLAALPLGDASIALLDGCVVGPEGGVARWSPGYLVFPLSDRLTSYLHSPAYDQAVARAAATGGFRCEAEALARARAKLDLPRPSPPDGEG